MTQCRVLGVALFVLLLLLASLGVASADQSVSVTFNPTANSGVTGTGTLSADGNQTVATLTANGLAPNTSHPMHFHTGTCAKPGPPIVPLPDFDADASGAATVSVRVNVPLASLMDGNHFIMTHVGPPPQIGPSVACADFPMMQVPQHLPGTGGFDPAIVVVASSALGIVTIAGGLVLRRRRA